MSPLSRLFCCLGIIMSVAAPAVAAETPATAPLGRANPYRPLIQPKAAPATPAGMPLPPQLPPPGPPAPRPAAPAAPAPKPVRPLDALSYVGVAYDGAEAIAAVQVSGRTSFMKLGERLDGAVITRITRHELVWRTAHGTVVKRLRRKKR